MWCGNLFVFLLHRLVKTLFHFRKDEAVLLGGYTLKSVTP
jgi:hypothetical protein